MTAPTLVSAASPFIFARGDTWQMSFVYQGADPVSGATTPIDLTGSVVTGELFLERVALPIKLTVANGGLVQQSSQGALQFTYAPAQSALAYPDPVPPLAIPAGYVFPNRLVVVVQDTLGVVLTKGIYSVLVYDPRSVAPGFAPQNGVGVLNASGPQGPAGPTQTVNGHAGASITLSAADVGTYTTAQIDALIAEAVAQAVQAATYPPGSLELATGQFNPAWA